MICQRQLHLETHYGLNKERSGTSERGDESVDETNLEERA